MGQKFANEQTAMINPSFNIAITCFDRLDAVADVWRDFERSAAASPHQCFAWVSAWADRSEDGRTQEMRIVVIRDPSEQVIALLPFAIRRQAGCRILEWLGGDQGNYASGLFDRAAWNGPGAPDFAALWTQVLAAIGRVDLVHLAAQPADIAGLDNPFRQLPNSPAAGTAHWFPLEADWEAHYNRSFSSSSRRKLRRSYKTLGQHGELTFSHVDTAEERLEVLAWIMDRKRERFAELGIADMFADAGIRRFYRALVALPHEGATVTPRMHALRCDGELVAANLGLFHQNRFYGLVIGTTNGPLRHDQPGKHLFRLTVAECAERGITVFDGGVGDDSHKLRWCTEERKLFHTLLPLTAAGRLYAMTTSMHLRAKAAIKASPELWSAYRGLRRLSGAGRVAELKSG